MRKLFGTDGIRGIANVDPMSAEMAMQLGRATAHIFKNREGRHRIVIGKDTRLSGYMLETALASGICSMGVDVLLVGPLPTPGIAFITTSMRADAGVVISASHNPFPSTTTALRSSPGMVSNFPMPLRPRSRNSSSPTASIPCDRQPRRLERLTE
jgi:phosphoglucosamine mutase